jgi:diguanylate cyclase (GGDEF)-like protein
MGIASHRARRKLAALRAQIAGAQNTLSALRAAIQDARSDAGLLAAAGMRSENEHLVATNLEATHAVTESKAALAVAVRASHTDALTGLRNRAVLWDRLSHELGLAGRLGHHVAVFFLDIDDFKRLNDARGHLAGDAVLQRVADVLLATVRSSDTVCRLGGDEFLVVASTASREHVDQLSRKIENSLREPFMLAGRPTTVSVSVGVSVFPEDATDASTLVEQADRAMYRAKRSRKVGQVG